MNKALLATVVVLSLSGTVVATPGTGEFDIARFDTSAADLFEPFEVRELFLLRDVLEAGFIAEETWVMVSETPAGQVALITDQMAYHHVAQGRIGGRDWMASFCVVCNSGVTLTPTIDGRTLHFASAGLYDGVIVFRDTETGTLWNHITGEAMHGPLAGRRLAVANLLQMNVRQALAMEPLTRIAVSDVAYATNGFRAADEQRVTLSSVFESNLGEEDLRRPRMEMGLGIWSETSRRYYPIDTIRSEGGALVDVFDGRRLLVYIDPVSSTPAALFVEADRARRQDDQIHLDDGSTVRSGMVWTGSGASGATERPMQIFTRWYGFSLTFADPDVYGP